MIRRTLTSRPVKYGFVTIFAWMVDFSVFILIQSMIGVTPALVAARVFGGLAGYEAHRLITFSTERRTLRSAGLYLCQWSAKLAIAIFGVNALIGLAGCPPIMAKLATEGFIFVASYLVLGQIFRRSVA